MRNFTYKRFLLLVMMLFSLVGCTLTSTTPKKVEITSTKFTTNSSQGYPAQVGTSVPLNNDLGYPAPNSIQTSQYPNQITIPTASPEYGIIYGQLIVKSDAGTPYLAPSLYLGPAVEANQKEYPPLVSLDTNIDLLATQDKNGKFVFVGVKPGKYGLIIWSPYSQTMILDPNKEGFPLLIEVTPNSITDIGVIEIP